MLSFTLSEASAAMAQVRRGRRVVTTLVRPLGAGPRSLRLPALAPARYVVAVTARDPAGNVGRASLAFRVAKR
jgi:hypothetical protein